MKNILIGSRALNYWYPHVPIDNQTDWDVISDQPIDGTEWHPPSGEGCKHVIMLSKATFGSWTECSWNSYKAEKKYFRSL